MEFHSANPRRLASRTASWSCALARSRGFTLVELLVVIGIIAVLISILLPSIIAAQKSAKTIQCATNMRQIATALIAYASDNRGKFPPNSSLKQAAWHDADKIGDIVKAKYYNSTIKTGGGVMVCPEDPSAWRSYSMNHWASSLIDPGIQKRTIWAWGAGDSRSSPAQLILLTEAWTVTGSKTWGLFAAADTVGRKSDQAGHLFGGGGGVGAILVGSIGRSVYCELDYGRHRNGRGQGIEPIGRLNIAYADGHVALRTNDELVESDTALSTLDSLWSPMDYEDPLR